MPTGSALRARTLSLRPPPPRVARLRGSKGGRMKKLGLVLQGRRRMSAPKALRTVVLLAMAAGLLIALQTASASSSAKRAAPKAANSSGYDEPVCTSHSSLCTDAYDNPGGEYVGHDEPSLEFKSGEPGSGNDMTYTITLPREPQVRPRTTARAGRGTSSSARRSGSGSRSATRESAPEFTKTCTPGLRRQRPRRHQSEHARLHRQAPRQRVHGAAVLRARLRPAVRGLRLRGDGSTARR